MEARERSLLLRVRNILGVREKQEQALQLRMARLEAKVAELDARAADLQRARATTHCRLRRARLDGNPGSEPPCNDYLRYLGMQIERCRREKCRLLEDRQQVREKLMQAMRSRRLLERHSDRLQARHERHLEQGEQKAMDRHSIGRFVRERGSA